ncbi:MAG: DNA alkylation repair protein [Patescibacteria group bacterium]
MNNNMKVENTFTVQKILRRLRAHANPKNVAGMARFGINPKNTLGISIPILRKLAKEIGKDHALAEQLWKTKIHEARILAGFIDDPALVTPSQMDRWVEDFDSWDVCDQVCCFLFDKTPYAYQKAIQWSRAREEFVKRAGFALMAGLAWHDKTAADKQFVPLLRCIEQQADDPRNFVKKAINWALRQIGKRSPVLAKKAVPVARKLAASKNPAARWVGSDALREFIKKGMVT